MRGLWHISAIQLLSRESAHFHAEERLDRLQRRGKPNTNISLQRNVRERRSLQDDTRLEMADLDLENRLNNAEKER